MQGSKSAKKRIINKNKAEKLRICQSFEKTFEENAEFDAYIGSHRLMQKANSKRWSNRKVRTQHW